MIKAGHQFPDNRVRNVCRLITEDHLAQIVLGGDVCLKQHLLAYGGKGYAHVQRKFLPLLAKGGLNQAAIHEMTVVSPARLLAPRASIPPA